MSDVVENIDQAKNVYTIHFPIVQNNVPSKKREKKKKLKISRTLKEFPSCLKNSKNLRLFKSKTFITIHRKINN